MKHIILAAILAVTAGVASAGTIVIHNESWYAVNTYVKYTKNDGVQETVCTCAGFDRSYSFGDESGSVSLVPLSDLQNPKHITVGPNDHIRVDIAGSWLQRPYYNVYDVPTRYWEKWTPPPKFGGL